MHFEAPSRFRTGWMISIQKKQKVNEYFDKKIRGLVNWWIDVTNKIVDQKNAFEKHWVMNKGSTPAAKNTSQDIHLLLIAHVEQFIFYQSK